MSVGGRTGIGGVNSRSPELDWDTHARTVTAFELEQLWNDLARTHSFQLHCAYPILLFAQEQDGELVRKICEEHSHVVPAEPYTSARNSFQSLRLMLQDHDGLKTF